jgi:hypothetical protein
MQLGIGQFAFFQVLLKDLAQGFNLLHRLRRQLIKQFEDVGLVLSAKRHLRLDSAAEY